jgi:hypothetical protein
MAFQANKQLKALVKKTLGMIDWLIPDVKKALKHDSKPCDYQRFLFLSIAIMQYTISNEGLWLSCDRYKMLDHGFYVLQKDHHVVR